MLSKEALLNAVSDPNMRDYLADRALNAMNALDSGSPSDEDRRLLSAWIAYYLGEKQDKATYNKLFGYPLS